jgi:D-alanine-D-alanine ligase
MSQKVERKFHAKIPVNKLKVWVLAPHLETADANIDYYYDFTQSIAEYEKTFAQLGVAWQWQPVTMNDYEAVIERICLNEEKCFPVVLNLCDGDEVNGTPGISILQLLETKGLIFTGADAYFYDITTSKIPMKEAFDRDAVSNAKWQEVLEDEKNIAAIFEKIGNPLIIKPAVSGGSMGVGVKSVVDNENDFKEQLTKLFEGYRGWNLTTGGVIAEQFITGPEFTTLIVGSYDKPEQSIIYPAVERVFHRSLPEREKFLSFDRLWEIYEDEKPVSEEDPFYTYEAPEVSLMDALSKLSWDAYAAVGGKGYGRIDIRMDAVTKKLYVLEVNAQCGISEDEDFTSIGAILRLSNNTFANLVVEILNDAVERFYSTKKTKKTKTVVAK